MKFQTLTLHNLASIEDAVIDFEAQPLASSEVFLITGQTGAGKSTLLDGICLALYGQTPRMANTLMEGDLLDGKDPIQANDPRILLRKNTGEGYAQLTFIGTNGRAYRAKWTVFRAHRKAEGRFQPVAREFEDCATGKVLTRKGEVAQGVAEAIGLDFAQFCRTTLLAQGEFTRFLNSKDTEKAAILEKITGMNSYTKIGAEIFRRTNELKRACEQAVTRMNGMQTLSDEEVDERRRQLRILETEAVRGKAELDRLRGMLEWLKKKTELHQQVEMATRALAEAEAAVCTPEFEADEQRVALWKQTLEVRTEMVAQQNSENERLQLQQCLQGRLSTEFQRLKGIQVAAERQTEALREAIRRTTQELEAEEKLRPFYESAETLNTRLRDLAEAHRKVEQASKQVDEGQQTLKETVIPAVKKAERDWQEAEAELTKKQHELEAAEAAVQACELSRWEAERERLQQVAPPLNTVRERLNNWQQQVLTHQETGLQLAKRDQKLENQRQLLATLAPKLLQAQADYEVCRKRYEAQRDTVDKFAKELRARLEVGMECPVCRRTLTEALPSEDDLDALVAQLKADTVRAEKALQEVQQEQNSLQATVDNEQKSLTSDRLQWKNDTAPARLHQLLEEAMTELKLQAMNAMGEQTWAALVNATWKARDVQTGASVNDATMLANATILAENKETMQVGNEKTRAASDETVRKVMDGQALAALLDLLKDKLQQRLDENAHLIKAGRAAELQAQTIRQRLNRQQEIASQAKGLLHQAQLNHQQMESRIETAKALWRSQQKTEEQLLQELHRSLDSFPTSRVAQPWEENPVDFGDALLKAAIRYRRTVELAQEQEKELQNQMVRCQDGASALQQILTTLPAWKTLEATPMEQTETRGSGNRNGTFNFGKWTNELHTLHAEVTSVVQQGVAARKKAFTHQQAVETYLQAHPELSRKTLLTLQEWSVDLIHQQEKRLIALQQGVAEQKAVLKSTQEKVAAHETKRPMFDAEIHAESNTQIESVKSASSTAHPSTETEIGLNEADDRRAEGLVRRIGELDQLLQEQARQRGGLQQELQTDEMNREKLGKLRQEVEQQQQRYEPWARLNELIGDATGSKFRKIAQSYVLSNLIHAANHYLAKLTDRYTLKVEPGSFLILLEDAYQGYASRIASTLSGGESFLVSLALALALSDIGHEFSVDTLFIDEGFGTLSGEPLQQAVNTLRSLHGQSGRHVGIISHVEELRERIPVQIRVEQSGKDASSRILVLPEVGECS